MKLMIINENTIINAEAIDYIDIRFNDDGDYICINLSLHGVFKMIKYIQCNTFLLTENNGKLYETQHGVVSCDVEHNQRKCIRAIKDRLIEYLTDNRKTPLNLGDVIRYAVNDIKPATKDILKEEEKEND